jgi:INO80 complex subunit B
MEVEFISEGKILYTGHIIEKIKLNSNSFTIPISAFSEKDSNEFLLSNSSSLLNKKTERKNLDDSFEQINPQLLKKKKYYDNFEEEEEEDLDEESEEYEESEHLSEEDNLDSENNGINSIDNINIKNNDSYNSDKNKLLGDSSESSSKTKTNQRLLRKYGNISDKDSEYYGLNKGHKKIKKELTEEEIAKKTEQARLRKLHAKKLIEDEKREAVERILNEDGRKLRERQKKQNEEMKKKTKMEEEQLKKNLTKIITKYSKDGKIYVRFPQGFLLPSVFNQTKKNIKPIEKCHVSGCNNDKKYTDPKTGFPYCSVKCFKILRSQFQTPEIKIKI